MTTPAQPEQSATDSGTPATGEQTPEQTTAPQQHPKPSENNDPPRPATGEDGPDWKARAREWETRSKANKQQLAQYEQQLATLKKALGLESGEEDLPDHIQRKLTEAEQAKEAAEVERDEIRAEVAYEKAVARAAKDAGADPDALLDSGSFRAAVGAELDEDGFTDDDLKNAVVKATKEFAKKPRFAANTPPPRSGGEITGGPPVTRKRPSSLHAAVKASLGG
jgi:hypothetical protein